MSQPEIQVLNDFMSWFVIQQTIMADDPLQCKDILEYLTYFQNSRICVPFSNLISRFGTWSSPGKKISRKIFVKKHISPD